MFPITLEFKDGKVATTYPPCYGFLRDEEWEDWGQRWHHGSFALKYFKRSRFYGNEESTMTVNQPLGPNSRVVMNCTEGGEDDVPSAVFSLKDLRVIWNSGANMLREHYASQESGKPVAWSQINSATGFYDKTRAIAARDQSPLDKFNADNNTDLTAMKVLSDLEAAIDAGRESCLRWDDEREIFGVSTLDVPCDRVLFYLMVHRELAGYYGSPKMQTFLHLHYNVGKPIMLAFLASRLIAYGEHDAAYYCGETGDSCILPATYFWVGCGKRYLKPTAVEWRQTAYSSGRGHERDDDMGCIEMNPIITGYDNETYEDFNDSLFGAIFGGYTSKSAGCLLDKKGGKPVANLVSEFYRTITKFDEYSRRGDGKYCLYWTSERSLQDINSKNLTIGTGRWVEHILSLLTEE